MVDSEKAVDSGPDTQSTETAGGLVSIIVTTDSGGCDLVQLLHLS